MVSTRKSAATRRPLSIGECIRVLRTRQKLTQGQLAAAIGSDTSRICRIELGEREARSGELERIAGAFGMKVQDLYKFAGEGR